MTELWDSNPDLSASKPEQAQFSVCPDRLRSHLLPSGRATPSVSGSLDLPHLDLGPSYGPQFWVQDPMIFPVICTVKFLGLRSQAEVSPPLPRCPVLL